MSPGIPIANLLLPSQDEGPAEGLFVSIGLDKNKLAVIKISFSWLAVVDQANDKEARTEEGHRQ
jgi:hypothetical protein